MDAIETLIACSGNDQNAVGGAVPDSVGKERMGSAGGGEFTPANVDNLSAFPNRLCDGTCKVELETRYQGAADAVFENRHDYAPTTRRDTQNWPIMLAKDHAGDVRAML
jgi:hypothetical protein